MADEPRPARAIIDDDADLPLEEDGLSVMSGATLAENPGHPRRALPAARKKHRVWKFFAALVSLVLVIALTIAGLYVWRASRAISDISRDPSFVPASTGRPTPVVDGPITFLLLGADTRPADDKQMGGDPGRSDTIIIGYVPKNRSHMYLISVPRDTWVPIPRHEYGKVNAAYAFGGVSLSWETIEKMIDVRLEHAAVMGFEDFMKLTDALDGVTVYNPIESEVFDGLCKYPEGNITIKGECALYYVRQREDLPGGDMDRMARQRAVISAIVSKALKGGIMTNPGKMNDFMTQVSKSVTVDKSLTDDKIRNYALSMRINSGDDIRTMTMPTARSDYSPDGQWIDVIDQDAIDELSLAMKTDTMDAYYDRHKDDEPYTYGETDEIETGPVPSSMPPRTPKTSFPTTKRATPSVKPSPTATPTKKKTSTAIPTATPTTRRS